MRQSHIATMATAQGPYTSIVAMRAGLIYIIEEALLEPRWETQREYPTPTPGV